MGLPIHGGGGNGPRAFLALPNFLVCYVNGTRMNGASVDLDVTSLVGASAFSKVGSAVVAGALSGSGGRAGFVVALAAGVGALVLR